MKEFLAELREQKLFWRFTALSLIAFIFIVFFVIQIISPAIENFVTTDAEREAVVFINRFFQSQIKPVYLIPPILSEAEKAFTNFFQLIPVRGFVAGTIISRDSHTIYTTGPSTAMWQQEYSDDPRFTGALALKSSAFFQPLTAAEQEELGLQEGFVMYIPITIQGEKEVAAVVKTISRTGFVREAIQNTETQIRYRIILSATLLYFILAIIVWGASRTIVRQTKELKIYADRLTKSLEKEKEITELQSQFITVASHQLNTPLSAIGWAVDLLHESMDNLENARESIEQSFYNLRSIVFDLLTVSEIGFKYEKKSGVEFDIAELTKEIITEFESRIKEKKIKLELQTLDSLIINADKRAIKKVLQNLIDNAIIYSHETGNIKIELTQNDSGINWIISDTGIGIPAEDQPSIFGKIFRAKNAVEKKNVGSGLGLFIAKTIVEGHGGKINFTSEQNKGTTFKISL
ncbi:MAG: HAMP domain-containing histidine kinase [Candidatus Harrisonbacteria bacterium]|nr:HAMP domain-containing histidine kinase [Candidatus Harrisonbacteria bacterium]